MALTGVGLQPSLYITLLLIFSPVISLFLFVGLFLFHSRSLFLSVFHLKSFSSSFFSLIVVARGDVVVLAVVKKKKDIFSAVLFLFFIAPQCSSHA